MNDVKKEPIYPSQNSTADGHLNSPNEGLTKMEHVLLELAKSININASHHETDVISIAEKQAIQFFDSVE